MHKLPLVLFYKGIMESQATFFWEFVELKFVKMLWLPWLLLPTCTQLNSINTFYHSYHVCEPPSQRCLPDHYMESSLLVPMLLLSLHLVPRFLSNFLSPKVSFYFYHLCRLTQTTRVSSMRVETQYFFYLHCPHHLD